MDKKKIISTLANIKIALNKAETVSLHRMLEDVIRTTFDVVGYSKPGESLLPGIKQGIIRALITQPIYRYIDNANDIFFKLQSNRPVVETKLLIELHRKLEALSNSKREASLVYILYGEPGTGKTYIAHALSKTLATCGFTLNENGTSDTYTDEEQDDEGNIRTTVKSSSTTKEIILVDEFDRGLTAKDLGETLRWIDKKRREPGVRIIFLTTNKTPKELDVALLRKGRVTDCIEVLPWTEVEAKEFCKQKEVPFDYVKNDTGKYYPGTLFEMTQEYWINQIEAEVRRDA